MKKLGLAAFLLVSVSLLYWISARVSPPPAGPEPAAALSGTGLDGRKVSLSGFAGRVVLVDFWASWCEPCRDEAPELVALQERLGGEGFSILSVSMDEQTRKIAPFARANKLNYPVIVNGGERPPEGWLVPGLPSAFLIGRDGLVLKRYFGAKDPEELERDVRSALAR